MNNINKLNKENKRYYAIFVSNNKKTILKDIKDEEGNLILKEAEFSPTPKIFINLNPKKGDRISFLAKGFCPQIYGLKHPIKAEIVNEKDKKNKI